MAKRIEKLNEQMRQISILQSNANTLQQAYNDQLESDPKYSLEPDPQQIYKMTKAQKEFIKQYVQYKSIGTAAELAGIDLDLAKKYFISFNTQQEIRRINLAMYHRQFSSRLLTIDEIGGYLSSLLVDENVAQADKLKVNEKIQVAKMIIDLNMLKINSLSNPQSIMHKSVEDQLKDLSIDSIKSLLKQQNKTKDIVIEQNVQEDLTPEESAYLSTLPTDELLKLIDETSKGGNENV